MKSTEFHRLVAKAAAPNRYVKDVSIVDDDGKPIDLIGGGADVAEIKKTVEELTEAQKSTADEIEGLEPKLDEAETNIEEIKKSAYKRVFWNSNGMCATNKNVPSNWSYNVTGYSDVDPVTQTVTSILKVILQYKGDNYMVVKRENIFGADGPLVIQDMVGKPYLALAKAPSGPEHFTYVSSYDASEDELILNFSHDYSWRIFCSSGSRTATTISKNLYVEFSKHLVSKY